MQTTQTPDTSSTSTTLNTKLDESPSQTIATSTLTNHTNGEPSPFEVVDGESGKEIETQLDKDKNIDPLPLSKSASLQRQLEILNSLKSRIIRLRTLPSQLLLPKPSLNAFGGDLDLGLSSSGPNDPQDTVALTSFLTSDLTYDGQVRLWAEEAFRTVSSVQNTLLRDDTQESLRAAKESDSQEQLAIPHTREQHPVVAVSPAAFPPYHLQPTHVFPPPQSNTNVYDINELTSFIREQNKKSRDSELRENNSGIKLGIWAHSRPKPGSSHFVSDPVTVRALLPDVAVVFMKLRHYHMDNHITPLSVESVVALGPRERKGPHSHSDFFVFQKLTQQLARMIEQEPNVSLVQFIELLKSYEKLFDVQCSKCESVLSPEDHIPPIARVWIENKKEEGKDGGHWEPRHIACLYG